MTENAKKFLEAVSQNEEELNTVTALKTKEEVIAYAKDKGFTLTDEDLENAQPDGELGEDELDAVAGGGSCLCIAIGGGSAGMCDDACVCVAGGGGSYNDSDAVLNLYERGGCRCVCVAFGSGDGYSG